MESFVIYSFWRNELVNEAKKLQIVECDNYLFLFLDLNQFPLTIVFFNLLMKNVLVFFIWYTFPF